MLCALIMAGGMGTRFWPLSTSEKPKQFLSLVEDETMIQLTVKRVLPIIPIDRIFVCTSKKYVQLVKEQLPNIPDKNIIVEPEGRNTAPCIALSSFIIKRYFPNSNMLVLPSDHLIKDEEIFLNVIKDSYDFINDYKDAIITLGMEVTRPETGYGYIKKSNEKIRVNNSDIYKVDKFVEKPNLEKAKTYLREGNYLWNGGMFLFNIDSILNKISEYMPQTFDSLEAVLEIKEEKINNFLEKNYSKTVATSIDYGVLEKDENIFVIPTKIGWDDIGSWNSIERYSIPDQMNNIIKGECVNLNSSNNIVITNSSKVFLDNVDDIYVIETEGKIFIGKRDAINDIKKLNKYDD